MSDSYIDVYIHLVWRTKSNRRVLTGELETFVHDKLAEYGRERDLYPLEVNSAWDHVHALYRWDAKVGIAEAVRALKSKSTVEWNNFVREGERNGSMLQWQNGYGAISVRRSDVEEVCQYIADQKNRHRSDDIWSPFEAARTPTD